LLVDHLIDKTKNILFDIVSSNLVQKKLCRLSYIDISSGLKNRNCLEINLKNKMARRIPFDVYFIDIDRFKDLNDYMGHIMGTKVLEAFILEVRKCLPKKAHFYRYGGDEFVVLIAHNDAKILKKGFIADMFNRMKVMVHGKNYFISSSVGKFQWSGQKLTSSEVLKEADFRMYKNKEKKRKYLQLENNEKVNRCFF